MDSPNARRADFDRRSYDYRAYGLNFNSDVELPWPAAAPGGEPDVAIRRGAVPPTLGSPVDERGCWQAKPGAYLLAVDGASRWLATEGGRQVRVAPASTGGDIGVHLLDSVLAACLQMRGILTLHASAIATAEGAVLFVGSVGIGKSTLAAALVDRGYSLLADGIVGVVVDGGGMPMALGGFPLIRLWADAIDALDESWGQDAGAPIRPGIENYPVPARRFRAEACAVRTVYVLSSTADTEVVIEPLPPVRAVAALIRNTFRLRHLRGLGEQDNHLLAVAAVSRQAETAHLVRPGAHCPPAALAARVAERLPAACP